jgi:hypothetical protein
MTTIRPGKKLLTRIEAYGVTVDDFGLQPFTETIVLKRIKENYWDDGGEIEYDDTPVTKRYREQITAINKWLSDATLGIDADALGHKLIKGIPKLEDI